jgi:predicted acylesterase/phospholipase RssA/CRP-like cAMP-binding protein
MIPSSGRAGENVGSLVASLVFRSLSDAALRSLEPELSTVKLKGGATLFAAGEPGDSLYVVVSGRLRALVEGEDGEHVLGEIGRGESVGEMALLTGEPRSATVRAVRDTELVKLSKAGFERLVERHPEVMLELSRLIIARYQRAIRSPAETRPAAIAVVPCSLAVPTEEFTEDLVEALEPGRRVLWLNRERLQRARGTPTDRVSSVSETGELSSWLQEQELSHDYLVYAADPFPSPWTRLAVRQADVILLVSSTDDEKPPGLLELLQCDTGLTQARRELVLLYDSARHAPRGTASWLVHLPVSSHHHVDPRRPQDYARLARLLTGNAIGLVLGGGGARGLAHIGVLRALEEARIPIDLVGGSSIGAIVGAQCASGWESARILAESRRVLVERGSLNDFTLPIVALLHGRRYIRMLEALFGDRLIEDLPLSYYCVSTNLTRSECMVHRTGPIRKWVAASMAVPGLGPPIFDGRDILVDGGVVNSLPVDVMRKMGRGPVFASSVSPKVELRLDRDYPDIPSPWRVLLSWINPLDTPIRVPNIASILMRTASLQKISAEERNQSADLIFEPPVAGYKLLDWRSLDTLEEIGYRSAVAAIDAWQANHGARMTRSG